MPPTSCKCPCSAEPQSLDHWRSECPLPPQARAWYHGSLQDTLKDTRHANGNVTITRLLGCPRQWLITDYLPYTYDPLSWMKANVGTLVQAQVAKYAEQIGAQAEVKVSGKLFGLDVTGSIDLLDGSLINEGKFHGEQRMNAIMGRAKWSRTPGVKELLSDDYVAQVNMQRLLFDQWLNRQAIELEGQTYVLPESVDKLVVSHSAMSDPLWPSERAPLRDEKWIGQVRPMSGDFTVEQNAGFVDNFQADFKETFAQTTALYESAEDAIRSCVPKVGVTQLFNKKTGKSWMCENCQCRKECDAIG